MTGSQVLREIMKLNAKASVIILTGYADEDGEDKYRALGAAAFVSQGMGIEAFLKIVENELAKRKQILARILVVDDEEVIRNIVRRFLERKDFEVETVSSGKDALAVVGRFNPHLILLDIDMPGMNGLDTLQKLRQAGNSAEVIMISGKEDVDVARQCMDSGACDYISKPFNFEYLETIVWAKILTGSP